MCDGLFLDESGKDHQSAVHCAVRICASIDEWQGSTLSGGTGNSNGEFQPFT